LWLKGLANQFVGFIDAIGELDGVHCLMDWKTTSSRYAEAPQGLLGLDPQLICYSWLTRISEVGLVVFVRKQQPEIQYLWSSARNLAVWWQRRSTRSKQLNFPLTAASGSHRTAA
jgi:hypothetical protein